MARHALDIGAFRKMFPQFEDAVIYPDPMLESWWVMASCAMSPDDNCIVSGDCLQTSLYLMMAHMGLIMTKIAEGTTTVGAVTSATIDKVSVSFSVPPYKSGWQFWLSQTPYGMQLWAILSARASGGFYIGGAPERAAFRRVGGVMF